MNDQEREEWRPLCNRCGQVVTDIDWCDSSTPAEPNQAIPGRMRCSTEGCYDERGSRETGWLEPGGLTLEDHAWLRAHQELAPVNSKPRGSTHDR